MGFFDDRPEPEPEPVPVPAVPKDLPVWVGPPKRCLPALLDERLVVFRTDDLMFLIHDIRVYSVGLTFEALLFSRLEEKGFGITPWERRRRPLRPGEIDRSDEKMRFGVELADGRSWTTLDDVDSQTGEEHDKPDRLGGPEEPDGPIVMARSGSGGDGEWSMKYWMWPLPPSGPLTFVADWPSRGIAEARVSIDADLIVAKATEAEVF